MLGGVSTFSLTSYSFT